MKSILLIFCIGILLYFNLINHEKNNILQEKIKGVADC